MKQLNSNSRHLRGLNLRRRIGLARSKRSIYKLPPFNQKLYEKIIEETFENGDFIRQLEETKIKLPHYDPSLVEDTLKFHIRKMAEEICKVRPWKRRVFIYKWGYIEIFPWCYNPFSAYYHHSETKRLIKKFKKEINQIKNPKQ